METEDSASNDMAPFQDEFISQDMATLHDEASSPYHTASQEKAVSHDDDEADMRIVVGTAVMPDEPPR
jgi:hypothetical protein